LIDQWRQVWIEYLFDTPWEESDGQSLQTSKAAANGTAPQKPELHGTIEEAADGEAEEILYPISFQQGCKRTS